MNTQVLQSWMYLLDTNEAYRTSNDKLHEVYDEVIQDI